mgnify:CR=1 FL=1
MALYDQQQLDELQLGLAGAGFIPGPLGITADLADAGVSLYRGDLLGAGLAGLAAIPGLGMAFSGRHALKAGRRLNFPSLPALEEGSNLAHLENQLDFFSYGRGIDDEFAGLLAPAMRQREPVFARSRAAVAEAAEGARVIDDPSLVPPGLDIPSPGVSRTDLPPHGPIEKQPSVIPEPFFDDYSLPSFEEIASRTGRSVDEVKDYFNRQGITESLTPPMRSLDEPLPLPPPRGEKPLIEQLKDPLNIGKSGEVKDYGELLNPPMAGAKGAREAWAPTKLTEEEAAIRYLTEKAFKIAMDKRLVMRAPLVAYTVDKTQFDDLFKWSMSADPESKENQKYLTVSSLNVTTPGAVASGLKGFLIPSDFLVSQKSFHRHFMRFFL